MLARAVKRSPQTSLVLTALAALVSLSALFLLIVSTQAGSWSERSGFAGTITR
jgi:hypothetical protein